MNDILKTLKLSFEQSNYQNGINTLLQNKEKLNSKTFHFYLGNFYLKQGDMGAGRYNLELAKKLGYKHQILENNIDLIESKIQTEDLGKSPELASYYLDKNLNLGQSEFLLISLVCISIVLILKKINKLKSWASTAILICLALLPLGIKTYTQYQLTEAIIIKKVHLYEGPSKVFAKMQEIDSGSKVLLSENNQGWFFVEFPRHLNGWISAESVGFY